MIETNPLVTVIIPTYHDWPRLSACLDALKTQSYSASLIEIFVVNNDPQDTPPPMELAENVTILAESKPGSYAARNLGLYDSVFAFQQADYVESGFAVTANLITRRECFELIGPFNSDLMSGGDVEWNLRATEEGLTMRYYDSVMVQHPARDSLKELLIKAKRVAGGRYKKERSEAIKWSFTRGILPPIGAYKSIVHAKLQSTKNTVILFFLFYMLKVYTSINIWLLALNLAQPSRK